MFLNRREFLKISALSACSLVISTGISGCDGSNDANVEFLHGVASGDPLSDCVIIWTRATTQAADVTIRYEVAEDQDFKKIIHNGEVRVDASTDYTLKVDVQNLDAGSHYYYRFVSNKTYSEIGKMKTLPQGSVEQVKMAVFSCSNYPNGYFNAYTEAAKIQDLDVTLHLGDYIYEYGMFEKDGTTPAYATQNAVRIGRELPEDIATELYTLEDYRKRYAVYHTDAGTQAIHKACPMIVVWDDHEMANDTYKEGAQNHDASEGNFDVRIEAALQAYFEWLPIRPIKNKKEIYRSFTFGDLLSLHMLETRIFARDKQLVYGSYFTQDGSFLAQEFEADIGSSTRTMLGTSQLSWLQSQMASSTTKWEVLGQQVLMGRMNLPSELLISISQLDYVSGAQKDALLVQINTSLAELATLKARLLQGDPSLNDEEKSRVNTILPYNLDAWDGYFVERERLLQTAKAYGKNLVVLAGDTHNAWASELKTMDGENVGVEFATTSVSSPGMEDYLGITDLEQAMQLEAALELLVDDLKYCNLENRGFMELVFTPEKVISNWHFVSDNESPSYTLNSSRTKSLQTLKDTHTLFSL